MKVHKIELYVVDFDGVGSIGVKETLENANFPNDCISPNVIDVQTVDIGEWSDDHPLNSTLTAKQEISRLFAAKEPT